MWWRLIFRLLNIIFLWSIIKECIQYIYLKLRCKIIHYCQQIKKKKCCENKQQHYGENKDVKIDEIKQISTIQTFEPIPHPINHDGKIKFNFLYPINTSDNLMISQNQPLFKCSKHPKIKSFMASNTKLDSNPQVIDLMEALDNKNTKLSSKLPPIYDQGCYGSCTANATALTWCILKLTNGSKYTNGKYNTVFNTLSKLPSISSIYYNARSISGLLVQTTVSGNKNIQNRSYIDEGADPSLFADVFNLNKKIDNTLLSGGYYYALVGNKYTKYYVYGGQIYSGICPNDKWQYPLHATTVYSGRYAIDDPYFLLYNKKSQNGLFDDASVTVSNVTQKIQQIKNTTMSMLGLYSLLPANGLYNMTLSRLSVIQDAPNNISQLTSSVFYKTLQSGIPVMLGYIVYSSFMNTNNTGIVPAISGSVLGGHCVVIVGLIKLNNMYYIKCRNSWSVLWGNQGYFYMPYSVFTDPRTDATLYVFNSAT